MNKSSPTSTLSEKANTPSLETSIPTRPSTHAESYSEETAAMGSLPDENIPPRETASVSATAFGLNEHVGMKGDDTKEKAEMPAISFSELCNFPPTKITVPNSPPPGAYEWYYSDQPEETAPKLSDTPGECDTVDSILDSYLLQDTRVTPDSPSSDYSPKDGTNEEDSDEWDNSRPGPYRAEDFLECLYDAYLDEDMTSELVDK